VLCVVFCVLCVLCVCCVLCVVCFVCCVSCVVCCVLCVVVCVLCVVCCVLCVVCCVFCVVCCVLCVVCCLTLCVVMSLVCVTCDRSQKGGPKGSRSDLDREREFSRRYRSRLHQIDCSFLPEEPAYCICFQVLYLSVTTLRCHQVCFGSSAKERLPNFIDNFKENVDICGIWLTRSGIAR
jgi:hypothetical protein